MCLHLAGGAQGRWRRVARGARSLPGFRLEDARWADLGVPVDVAFFMHSSAAGKVMALYPGPTGATESRIPLDAWQGLLADNPAFAPLEPDVEALLVALLPIPRGVLERLRRYEAARGAATRAQAIDALLTEHEGAS